MISELGAVNIKYTENVFEEYDLYADLPTKKKGGAGILVKRDKFNVMNVSIESGNLNMKCNCSGCVVESVFLSLKTTNININLGCVYRHPNGNISHFNDSLSEYLSNSNQNDIFVLGGDINIDLLKTSKKSTQNYFDILQGNNYIPVISIPTRFSNKSATLIDHLFVKLPKSKTNNLLTSGNLITDISDHLPNFMILNVEIQKKI